MDKCQCVVGRCEPLDRQQGGANTTFKSDMSCSSVDIGRSVPVFYERKLREQICEILEWCWSASVSFGPVGPSRPGEAPALVDCPLTSANRRPKNNLDV